MKIKFRHCETNFIKEVPQGFSWTTLFFGFFVPLIRGWYVYAAIHIVCGFCSFGLSYFIFPFIINRHYMNHLIEKGYKPLSQDDVKMLEKHGFTFYEGHS